MHRFLIEEEQKKGYETEEVSSLVLLLLLWVWRAAAGNSARAIGPQHLICMVLSSSPVPQKRKEMEGNDRLWKENPCTPCFQGPSGPEGMPEAKDSVALCKQADRQGKKDHRPVLPRCGQGPDRTFFMSQEQRRRYPLWTRTRLLLYRRLYADTTSRGEPFS